MSSRTHLNWEAYNGVCCSVSFFSCANCTCQPSTHVRYDKQQCEIIYENDFQGFLYSCLLPISVCCTTNEYAKLMRLEKRKLALDLFVRSKFYFLEKQDTYHWVTKMKIEQWESDEFGNKSVAVTITYGATYDSKFKEFNKHAQKMLSAINPMANSVYDFNTKQWKFIDPVNGRPYTYMSDNSSVGGSSGVETHSSQMTSSIESPSVSSTNGRVAKRGSYASDLSSVVSTLERIAAKKNINSPKVAFENIDLTNTAISLRGKPSIERVSEEKDEYAQDTGTKIPFNQPIETAAIDDEPIPIRALSRAESIVPVYPPESADVGRATNSNKSAEFKSQSIFDVVASVDEAYFSYMAIVAAAKSQNQEHKNYPTPIPQSQQQVQQRLQNESFTSHLTTQKYDQSIPETQVMDRSCLSSKVEENVNTGDIFNSIATPESNSEGVTILYGQGNNSVDSKKSITFQPPNTAKRDSASATPIKIPVSTANSTTVTIVTNVPAAKESALYNTAFANDSNEDNQVTVYASGTGDEASSVFVNNNFESNEEDTDEQLNETKLECDVSLHGLVPTLLNSCDIDEDRGTCRTVNDSQDVNSVLEISRTQSSAVNIHNLEDQLNRIEESSNETTASSVSGRTDQDSARNYQRVEYHVNDEVSSPRADCSGQDAARDDQLTEDISNDAQASSRSGTTDKESTLIDSSGYSVDLIVQSDTTNTEETSSKVDVISNFEIELYLFELEKATREAEARRKQFIMGLVNGATENGNDSVKDEDSIKSQDSVLTVAAKAALNAADFEEEQDKLRHDAEQAQQSSIAFELGGSNEVQQSSALRKTV